MKDQDANNFVTQSLDELYQALKQGRNDIFEKSLTVAAKFHKYSFRNMMMIYRQQPEATAVAGYHAWRKLNRWVNEGESGIAIYAPISKRRQKSQDKKYPTSNDAEESSDEKLAVGFRVVYVFDISQTSGDELIEESPILGNPGRNLAALIGVYRELKIKLVFTKLPGAIQGYSLGGEVRVREELDDASLFRVLVHELAHELMHKSIPASSDRKAFVETEAEAVAFVVATACGISCLDRSADYIALSNGDAQLLQESLERIHKSSSQTIRAIEAHLQQIDSNQSVAA